MRMLCVCLGAFSHLVVLWAVAQPAAAQSRPRRVAVISSSGVNNDFRSFHEYDGTLSYLGWPFDKFRNTDLALLFKRADQYDLVLTTSLWNYGDPQDMVELIPRWKEYLSRGGVVILTDMAYAPMCDWLGAWESGLAIEYGDAQRDLGGAQAGLDLAAPSPFLITPDTRKALNYWAHFRSFGQRYKPWAKTKAGTAVGLVAQVERGVLIVTTAWALSPEALQSIYTNACAVRSGFLATLSAPKKAAPGRVGVSVALENLRDAPLDLEIQIALEAAGGTVLYAGQWLPVSLQPLGRRELQTAVPCDARGKMNIVLSCRGADWHYDRYAVESLKIPPLASVHVPRTVFLRGDRVSFTLCLVPPLGATAGAHVEVADASGRSVARQRVSAANIEDEEIALGPLAPGHYEILVSAKVDAPEIERAETSMAFEVVDMERPSVVTAVGPNGEILLNGEPVFLIGTYHVGAEDLAAIKDLGFNCVTGPIYGGEQSELTTEQLTWHDEARRQGLWVITELSEFIRGSRRNYDKARELVSRLRLHPATIAHYTIDEPAGSGLAPEDVAVHTKVVREADPDHITLIVEVPSQASSYANIADATGTDPYPIGATTPASLDGVGAAVRELWAASSGKPVIGVIQAHRQPPPNSVNRYPTPEELRCMAYLALNNGAKGLLFYAWGDVYQTDDGPWHSGFKYSSELRNAFGRLNAELGEMGMRYVRGHLRRDSINLVPQDCPVDAAWIEEAGRKTLVCINPTKETVQAFLSSPAGVVNRVLAPFEVYIEEH